MPITIYTFNQLTTNMLTAIASQTTKITNFSPGSITLALVQSFAGNSLLLENLITQLAAVTRLSTSTGSDVDSFINDFGMTRLPATPAVVALTLTRTAIGVQLNVPLNVSNIVQTVQNQVQFAPVADTTQSSWDPINNQYFFNPSQFSITITANALVAGSAGNVAANTITQIVAGFSGVQTITNPLAAGSGVNQETDAQVRVRFPLYLASLKTANKASVEAAIESVQAGISYQIIEYFTFAGVPKLAYFTVVVDDGSGNAPQSFLNAVYAAVNATRAAGSQFEVDRPTDVSVAVSVTLVPAIGFSVSVVKASVTAALTAYINGLGVGANVPLGSVANVIQTTPGVFSYLNLLLNGASSDVAIAATQLARIGTVVYT